MLGTSVIEHPTIVVFIYNPKPVQIFVISPLQYTAAVRIVLRIVRSVPSIYTASTGSRAELKYIIVQNYGVVTYTSF